MADKEGAELLFKNIFIRAGQKSTIITMNLSSDRLSEIFVDSFMTVGLTCKSYVVNMNGSSYRMKETKAWFNTLEQ